MSYTPREVLIPVVGGAGAGDAIIRVRADGTLPAPHAAGLEGEISELLQFGLYAAGQQARAAVPAILGRSGWTRLVPMALWIQNPGEAQGLSDENAASAELGLALGLVMFRHQSAVRQVIATGRVAVRQGDAAVVAPVHHIARKMQVVLAITRQAGAAAPPGLFLTPATDPDGTPVAQRYAGLIAQLAAIGIEVRPVADLRDAARAVGGLDPIAPPLRRWLGRTAAGIAAFAALGGLAAWALDRPIALTFEPAAFDGGRIAATPLRARRDGGMFRLLPGCDGRDGTPQYRPGDLVMAKVRAGSAQDWTRILGRHRLSLVAVTPGNVVKVIPLPGSGELDPGGQLSFAVTVSEPAEEMLLYVLARRLRPVDGERLSRELRAALEPRAPAERLNVATLMLGNQGAGRLGYQLRIVAGDECHGA
jgi:hypothetical protein